MSTEDRIDIEALAREAGAEISDTINYAYDERVCVMRPNELRSFVAAVLEEAAKLCDWHVEYRRNSGCPHEASAIHEATDDIRAEAAKLKGL